MVDEKVLRLTFDEKTINEYADFYFMMHPKARKKPIANPYHESINVWMIMKRPMMNALKGKWKEFIVWFVGKQGYTNLRIQQCEMDFITYYSTNRRHDVDNSVPKFILDGFCESGLIEDDDCTHLQQLTLRCDVDAKRPRTEIFIHIKNNESKEN